MMIVNAVQQTCIADNCGVVWWLEEKYDKNLLATKRLFYCPSGHGQQYTGESDADKARRLFQEKSRAVADKEAAERQATFKDGIIERLQKSLKRKRRKPRAKKVL